MVNRRIAEIHRMKLPVLLTHQEKYGIINYNLCDVNELGL